MSFEGDIRAGADLIKEHDSATIISHIDADGISSESILSIALKRAGISVKSVFVRQLDPLTIPEIPHDKSLKIFSDLGSGQKAMLTEGGITPDNALIIDHHVIQDADVNFPEVNCLSYGHEKMSAAGVSYFVARDLDSANTDLAKLSIIGNIGDMMDRENLCLTGPAKEILNDGIKAKNVKYVEKDLNIYGISSRPVTQAIAYSDDLEIPGVSRDVDGARMFLEKIGMKPLLNGRWPAWEELPQPDKQIIVSSIVDQMVANGCDTSRLFSDHYIFTDEKMINAPLRNASEFATLLNSCGRWKRPELGGQICRGDRSVAYRDAEHMLRNHRGKIREVMTYITDTGVTELSHISFIHVHDLFPDTIVGIGAGMALSRLNPEKPILIMCEDSLDPNNTKISMRTKPDVIAKGVDLQRALSGACIKFEGSSGGGHRIAAGAFISKQFEQEFIEEVNRIIGQQYASKN